MRTQGPLTPSISGHKISSASLLGHCVSPPSPFQVEILPSYQYCPFLKDKKFASHHFFPPATCIVTYVQSFFVKLTNQKTKDIDKRIYRKKYCYNWQAYTLLSHFTYIPLDSKSCHALHYGYLC